jgi:hypothetical protein
LKAQHVLFEEGVLGFTCVIPGHSFVLARRWQNRRILLTQKQPQKFVCACQGVQNRRVLLAQQKPENLKVRHALFEKGFLGFTSVIPGPSFVLARGVQSRRILLTQQQPQKWKAQHALFEETVLGFTWVIPRLSFVLAMGFKIEGFFLPRSNLRN